jgi:predicted methyltransferase
MTFIQAILGLILLSPGDGGGSAPDQYIQQALESPARLEADIEKDANRHPAEVLKFFGIKPGMAVLDLFSGGGYYTTIVSGVVGEDGSVTAHNNPAYLAFVEDELKLRAENGEAANIVRLESEADQLELPEGKFDAALAVLTWHDFYYVDPENNWPKIDAEGMIETLCHGLPDRPRAD